MATPKPKVRNKNFLDEDIVKYIELDDVDSLDRYINRAKDLEKFLALKSEETGQTMLLVAAEQASVECADRLIECGADVNCIGKMGYTPLLWCCSIGYPNHIVVAKRLLEEDETDVRIFSDKFETPLNVAIKFGRFELADAILNRKRGADINHRCGNGNTSLVMATFANKLEIMEYCIKNKADLEVPNMNGETAFMVACKVNNIDAAGMLLMNGANINSCDRVGRNSLMHAIMTQQLSVIEALLAVGEPDPDDDEAEVKAVGDDPPPPLPKPVNLEAQDDWGYSALMHCAKYKELNPIAEKLIAKGIDILIQDRHGNTAISLAAMKKNLELVQKLILAGADVKHKNEGGESVMDIVGPDLAWDLERYIVKQKPEPAVPRREMYKWRVKVEDITDVDEYRRLPDRSGADELSVLQSEEGSLRGDMSISSAKYSAPGERLADHK